MRTRKSFTGCWTCRSRRLKCDETKPRCRQCTGKGVACEGYSTKLQWLHPVSAQSAQRGRNVGERGLQRRRLLPASKMVSLKDGEIETALFDLDRVGNDVVLKSRGPFSVFRLEADSQPGPLNREVGISPPIVDSGEPASSAADSRLYPTELDSYSEADSPLDIDRRDSDHPNPVPEAADVNITDAEFSAASQHPLQNDGSGSSNGVDDATSSLTSLLALCPQQQPASPFGSVHGASAVLADTFSEQIFLTSEVKYLLRNYAINIVPIYSPLHAMENPWKRHHLPCALQCSIELEILGSSTPSRKALLYSVLTISAYNLRNTEGTYRQAEAWNRWNNVASRYRGQALRLLKVCVGESCVGFPVSVYNDLLAAMLAMVTIDVISGDTQTSAIHLQACETLIRAQVTQSEDELPSITKGLHVLFIYLRIMQEATRLLFEEGEKNTDTAQPTVLDDSSVIPDEHEPEDLIPLIASQPDQKLTWWSCELIYGLPNSLLLLLRKATRALQKYGKSPASEMQMIIDQLEDEILEWPVDVAVSRLKSTPVSHGNHQIMEHYTRAFHQALIIFYCQRARNMHQRHVQQYVQQVITHLEQVERAKERVGLRSGSMLWPAFVAGSQALGADIRARFLRWLDLLDMEGIWTSNLTKDALVEIWSRDKASAGIRSPCKVHLVLT